MPVAEDTLDWLMKHPEAFLPHSMTFDDVCFDYIVQSSDNTVNSVVVAIARKDALDQELEIFRKSGFRFSRITNGPLEFILANLQKFEQTACGVVLIEKEQAFVFVLVNRDIKLYKHITIGTHAAANDIKQFIEEIDPVLVQYWEMNLYGTPIETWYIAGECPLYIDYCKQQGRNVTQMQSAFQSVGEEIVFHTAMSTSKKGGNRIQLAQKTDKDLARRMRFKRVYRVAANIGLAAAGLVIAFLLLLRLGLYAWDYNTRDAYASYSGTIEKLKSVKQENRKLSLELRQDQGLFANRSGVFRLLESVRNSVPDSAWFSSLNYQKGVDKGPELLVTGFAVREEALKNLLVQLESKKEFGKVTLNFTKDIPAAKAFGLSKGKARYGLVYFKITMAL
ncbi:MAG: hypothetical protein A2268_04265 [Candidatus Raymondbacteria bacterium RifOxyA12_full_50_37]|uniref:Uncharacterized protein n=1 Tax=Candidatus Raymondbacteria bacterium RIFOXYD12_FULL_49_13 TaxID=1817890 RepID=A0A1F7FBC6_UNCRA|nr:MAG: hypothetical protein A2268_04265 [Candidatus Raymondbacteria bacterium RifOxyA12_full_50_37]OGJ92274.1 MAG: hypothetical protein A2350_14810 [Candidatus Raymondbacteria bacterium RifOxyB12_full_50_8]OGJ92562.1 MAG: hypothetical protein A2248_05685 [Candidatus Raymondbacteria bacterium RIFOXYA2_FULL_49_16]OGJ97916.1 MAG: hypothetical protein A2453_02710 [Candidatus Raymondbacteria bacterium RIFOXYC2_FULL_50_21]OGK03969.1 MAG: hypothetical protein A2519_04575 [Candidatus Raymondbacteria b